MICVCEIVHKQPLNHKVMNTSSSEKGHAKNIANFKLLINNVVNLGTSYNPTNPLITVAELQAIYDKAFADQKQVNILEPIYRNAVANREDFFNPLSKFITKLRKAYKATQGVKKNDLDNFMTIARKIKGDRKSEKKQIQEAENEEGKHSTAQLSFDQRTNNFSALIALLEANGAYNPNEDNYKIAALKDMHQKMLELTDQVSLTFNPFNTARSKRNKTVYFNQNNLVDTAYNVKDYLGSILKTNSSEYKAMARIKFSRI